MRPPSIWLALLLAAVAAGCSLRGNAKPAAAAPPAPAPSSRAASPPPEPLSVPQTQVQLPPVQPISAEALATAEEPAVVALPEPPPAKPSRRIPVANVPPLPKPEVTPPAGATPAPAQTQTIEPARPPMREAISADEQKRLTEQLAQRKREIGQKLAQVAGRNPGRDVIGLMDRIRSFVKLADDSAARGDLRQADALAERALILSRELPSVR